MLAEKKTRRRFMLLAQEAGMTNGEYIYIHVNELVDLTIDDPHAIWSTGADDDELAKVAFRSAWEVISLQSLLLASPSYDDCRMPDSNLYLFETSHFRSLHDAQFIQLYK